MSEFVLSRKMILAIIVVLIVASIGVWTSGIGRTTGQVSLANEKSGDIKIGLIMPLTGDAASWGQETQRGAEIAYDEIKNETINGRKIKLLFEDDKCIPQAGLSAFKKFVEIDKGRITGGMVCSSVVLAIAPVAEKDKVIVLASGASSPKITDSGDFIFRVWPSDTFEGGKTADYALQNLGIKSIAILYLNNDYGLGLKDIVSKKFLEAGKKVTSSESFELNSKDYRTQLEKIRNSNPEAIFVVSNPEEMPLILKQMTELGINKTIFAASPAMEASETISQSGGTAEGVIFSSPKMEITSEFNEKYKAKYGTGAGYISNTGYDAVMLLYKAIKQCNDDNPECVRDYLYTVKDYRGAGGIFSFDSKGEVIFEMEVKKIQDGKIVKIN